jgi:cation diffusion facilitator CzcD-associated flavoprotein CzcO
LTQQASSEEGTAPAGDLPSQFDAIVVGAGINGLYMLHRLRELGLSVRLLEAGDGVGATWYWNRYPGARLDSESYTYGYFFSEELQKEWSWSESFAGQPELERYFNFAVDRLSLRPDIEFNARVRSARYDEDANRWEVQTASGGQLRATFLVTAVGMLSAPQFPRIPGLDEFAGVCHHTGLWPAEPVDFHGKRVAVIGTGASGVQVVAAIGPQVEELTVFQRTPNWCTPINNSPISADRAREIWEQRKEIWQACQESPGGFIHKPRQESALDVSPEEQRRYLEELWNAPGLSIYQANFKDLLTSWDANHVVTDFLAAKVRERVKDPDMADKLIPKDHGFAMKRPPLETRYFEVFNQDNVKLINLDEEPIDRVTPSGIQTPNGFYDVDIIVLATGFDAVTGSIKKIDIRGRDGMTIKDHWADGPHSALGMMTAGFPNMFIVGGPHGAGGNNPRSAEHQVDWISECIRYLGEHGYQRIEASAQAEDEWTEHANETVAHTLQAQAQSWYFGSNTPGKRRVFLLYAGGQIRYRAKMAEVASSGYRGFVLDRVTAGERI